MHGYGATLSVPSLEDVERARITGYSRWLSDHRGIRTDVGYAGLWRWSAANPADFWSTIWDYFDVLGDLGDGPVIEGGQMPAISWFPALR